LPRVVLLNGKVPSMMLPSLYRAADAFVLPSRGEGWGLPIMEAMAMGVAIIATNWSGITEYLSTENGYPINFTLGKVPGDNVEGHRWAIADQDGLRSIMRAVADNITEAQRRGKKARSDVAQLYSHEAVASQVITRLRVIEGIMEQRRLEGELKVALEAARPKLSTAPPASHDWSAGSWDTSERVGAWPEEDYLYEPRTRYPYAPPTPPSASPSRWSSSDWDLLSEVSPPPMRASSIGASSTLSAEHAESAPVPGDEVELLTLIAGGVALVVLLQLVTLYYMLHPRAQLGSTEDSPAEIQPALEPPLGGETTVTEEDEEYQAAQ